MSDVPTTPDELLEALERDGIDHLWVTYLDMAGKPSAKTIPRNGFRSAVRNGVVFAKANFDIDTRDHAAEASTLLADSGDMMAVPDPRSYVMLPRYPGTARVHTWLRDPDGSPWLGCPRTRLQEQVDALAAEGFTVQAALEPEFYLLTKDEFGNYHPADSVRGFGEAGLAVQHEFLQEVVDELTEMGVTVAQIGKEFGPGQYEISVRHGSPFEAIDDYQAVKDVIRYAARELGYVATFMPKVFAEWVGCSLHLHLSLWDTAGEQDLTPNPDDEQTLSDPGKWFMGGLLKHVAALTALGSPSVNSYKRLLPGSWAPANTYWGYGNRSGIVRIPGPGGRRHLEFRSGDNTCQPALFLAGVLAAGLDGIRNQIDPGPPFDGDVGHMTPEQIANAGFGFLPRDLPEALAALEADEVVTAALGPVTLEHMLIVRRSELESYHLTVHPWERETYLEVV
jgi:glutamine synthetase